MSGACKACGAPADLERGVLFEDLARACMACGHVRVFTIETIDSDNPHVDPRDEVTEVSVDPVALEWIGAFPRRTKSGDAFMPSATRAPSVDALAAIEGAADESSAKSLLERLRTAGCPGAPPTGHLSNATSAFTMANEALTLSPTSPLVRVLALAERGATRASSITSELARDFLATRAHTLAEVAGSIHAYRPDTIAVAIDASLEYASPEDIAALEKALHEKLAKTMPHSSDIAEIERSIAALRKPRQ